mmetsp:Transcript_6425/g.19446  ORF Transcript_6425/g.19446 Transcript_6425/m.19446 type:complete len:866 (+) Transcript_6425:173-2770(+)|eukprot:CAMPEP_0198733118 /NCGR_PEP_ID=MMETSP1475-20131203/43007_1 /TAXON_ID= ORGANISM="Unidentified sp., Strain CCMP1999" /NCGR_SAMPLE_ID=MMETSP1475 /ASSEMBLY_ACC=CAM_ASM_001111 /LENGTH=865 /DNA_ID=CAMNT_0044496365 /DNA_START=89 /DNA_END=2686 /DNA_ORIENTATION=+
MTGESAVMASKAELKIEQDLLVTAEDDAETCTTMNETTGLRRSARVRAATSNLCKETENEAKHMRKRKTDGKQGAHSKQKTSVKQGLKGMSSVDTTSPLGVVDSASGLSGEIVVIGDHHDNNPTAYDTMMVLVDPAQNMDKFIVLQVIQMKASRGKRSTFAMYERWGRTGTAGQSLTQTFTTVEQATKAFEDKFRAKSGLSWGARQSKPVAGCYRVVDEYIDAKQRMTLGTDACQWQYWVGADRVDGKSPGWHDYDKAGSAEVEQLYQLSQTNSWLSERLVCSGLYTYKVSLRDMTQQNTTVQPFTVRRIRRVTGGQLGKRVDALDCKQATQQRRIVVAKRKKPKTEPKLELSAKQKAEPTLTPSPEVAQEASMVEIPVDSECPDVNDMVVVKDYDATLNQTDITKDCNSNKYYRVQLLKRKRGNSYVVWTRWGRVGETTGSQTQQIGPFSDLPSAVRSFEKKFRDKTANDWNNRADFLSRPGKYELLEVDYAAKAEAAPESLCRDRAVKLEDTLPCSLDTETKDLVTMLFGKDLYADAMRALDVDVNKLPLGNLKAEQVQRGMNVLKSIEHELNSMGRYTVLCELSSRFYTAIPHDFGRRRPPVICDQGTLRRCYDRCDILLDIEQANEMMDEADQKQKEFSGEKAPHPADVFYASLGCTLELLQGDSEEYKKVAAYFRDTKSNDKVRLCNAWRLNRHGEADRFERANGTRQNHKLLWHGTNIAVVAPICKSGLRIMPNAGGRVGKGIYLASENAKSYGYTQRCCQRNIGCMFLVEAALGRECSIYKDDHTLKEAPNGYDSVVARGRQSPSEFQELMLDGRVVQVPGGEVKSQESSKHSTFWQDEYLVYREEQAQLRYILTVSE